MLIIIQDKFILDTLVLDNFQDFFYTQNIYKNLHYLKNLYNKGEIGTKSRSYTRIRKRYIHSLQIHIFTLDTLFF